MSLGSGHLWRTDTHLIGTEGRVLMLRCVRCGVTRGWWTAPMRFRHGRPLGTCAAGSHTAQRRAKGEAEIREILERFE